MSEALQKVSIIPQDDRSEVPALANWMTPMSMLDRAVSGGASIEVLEKLMGLQERHEANQARKAFDVAMANAQAEMPVIVKNRHVYFEPKGGGRPTDYWHEDLAQVVSTIKETLHKHGLAHRFRTEQFTRDNKPIIKVTCVITGHGHREETPLESGPDSNSSSMNDIQRIKSAVTYLERMTLEAALGLAAAKDDDGRGTGATVDKITPAQAYALTKLIEANGKDSNAFLRWAKKSDPRVEQIEDIAAAAYDSCVQAINYKAPANDADHRMHARRA